MEISGHNQVYRHVLTTFEQTNEFILENEASSGHQEEIKSRIHNDLSSTLVLILDNMGRQKAMQALEVYREHEKFRKELQLMNGEMDPRLQAAELDNLDADLAPANFANIPVRRHNEEEKKALTPAGA